MVSISISPHSEDDRHKLVAGLAPLTAEDPSLVVRSDAETGAVVVVAIGERQIGILIDRLKREYGVHASVGAPSVVCKTTLDDDGIAVLLGPFVLVEVTAPADYGEELTLDLTSRRAELLSVEASRGGQIIRAVVPLSETFGYGSDLHHGTFGQGSCAMQFAESVACPPVRRRIRTRRCVTHDTPRRRAPVQLLQHSKKVAGTFPGKVPATFS